MIEHIFIARARGGRTDLAKAKVLKEAPGMFLVDPSEAEDLIGSQWTGSRVLESRAGVFDNECEALLYLVERAKKYLRSQEVKVSKARSEIRMLEQALEQSEESRQ